MPDRRTFAWLIALVLAMFVHVSAAAQQSPPEIGWLGLFNGALVEWLENENRLRELCGTVSDPSEEQRCRDERLAPKVQMVRLWTGASEQAASAGSLLLMAVPGKGLRAMFVSPRGGAAMDFQPDLFDADWGYGPHFHQTFLERRGTWFRLPEGPFPSGTWISAADLGGEPDVRRLEPEQIVSSPFGDLFVLGIDPGVLRARLEQDADMWCEPGAPPPLAPWKEMRIPVRDLYTPTGHLRLRTKYTRGC